MTDRFEDGWFGERAAGDTQQEDADAAVLKLQRDLDRAGRPHWVIRAAVWLAEPGVDTRLFLIALGVSWFVCGALAGAYGMAQWLAYG